MKKYSFSHLALLSLLFVLLFVSIPTTTIYASNYDSKHLIAKNSKEKIYLYYDKKSDAMYEGFYLKAGSKVKYFPWESLCTSSDDTALSVINGNCIAIILTTGTGTGVHQENLYLLDKKSLKVLTVENPLDVMKDNLVTNINPPFVTLKIGNNTWSSTYPDVESSHFFETVGYGSIIKYDIHNNYFDVIIPTQITPALFIGDVKISYVWNSKRSTFSPTTINFNFEDTDIN
jgi:hypothetical protein